MMKLFILILVFLGDLVDFLKNILLIGYTGGRWGHPSEEPEELEHFFIFILFTRIYFQLQDELHIVIRKQLSNNNPKYKRIGVIGSLMIVLNMAYRSGTDQEGKLSSDAFSGVGHCSFWLTYV